jgi:hypothetical protein
MRHRRTNEPGAQSRADQRSRVQRGGPIELPPWAADSANDNARASGPYLPSAQGNWEDDATTLYRRSEVSVRSVPRKQQPKTPPPTPQVALERISSMPDDPRFGLEGSLPRSIHPELSGKPSRWRALPGLLVLGACAYFSVRAPLWIAPLPYGRVAAPLTGISAAAHMRATASAPIAQLSDDSPTATVGAAVIDQAFYTVVPAAAISDTEATEVAPVPRTAAGRKQRTGHSSRHGAHGAHAAIARRIEPLRDPVESEEPEVAPAMDDAGLLQVNSRPWSRVLLDGHFVGHTPQLALRVSAGKHHILLVNEQMDMRKAFDVTVPAGQTVSRVELLDDNTE